MRRLNSHSGWVPTQCQSCGDGGGVVDENIRRVTQSDLRKPTIFLRNGSRKQKLI
jgi:hypothetical protein